MSGSILYDAPGPRTRRVTLVGSLIATAAAAVLAYIYVYRPLARGGQLAHDKWSAIVDPSDPNFPLLWQRLGEGLRATALAAAGAIAASLLVGAGLAVLVITLRGLTARRFAGFAAPLGLALRALAWTLRIVTRVGIEVFRGVPVVVTILFVWLAMREFGVKFPDNLGYLVIGLTIYNSIVIGEILRSGMDGLPTGQREAAESIGLSPLQTIRLILAPQAFRIMLPALIGQLVVILKDTSLGFIILYPELMRTASLAVLVLNNPLQLYFVVGIIYVTINIALSQVAHYVQRRLARSRRVAAIGDPNWASDANRGPLHARV